ncbi:MAG: hypothetical protein P4N60_14135 [Verrucomicrobiae bacterium]|nr:hypothetical protein [Verrucomicrobiae bacterium]
MSARDILIQEIKYQPESVVQELLLHLKFITQKREMKITMDDLVRDTWESIGPAPEINYDKLQPETSA